MAVKSTDELMQNLQSKETLETYLAENKEELVAASVQECLNRYAEVHGLSKSAVVEASQIEHSYGYQLFSGKRKRPSRNVLLRLALAMSLTLAETQQLLRSAQVSMLYPRQRRDCIIIKAIINQSGLMNCDLTLYEYGEEPLSQKE